MVVGELIKIGSRKFGPLILVVGELIKIGSRKFGPLILVGELKIIGSNKFGPLLLVVTNMIHLVFIYLSKFIIQCISMFQSLVLSVLQYFYRYQFDSPVHLKQEEDGLGIVGNYQHEFLHRVPGIDFKV